VWPDRIGELGGERLKSIKDRIKDCGNGFRQPERRNNQKVELLST